MTKMADHDAVGTGSPPGQAHTTLGSESLPSSGGGTMTIILAIAASAIAAIVALACGCLAARGKFPAL